MFNDLKLMIYYTIGDVTEMQNLHKHLKKNHINTKISSVQNDDGQFAHIMLVSKRKYVDASFIGDKYIIENNLQNIIDRVSFDQDRLVPYHTQEENTETEKVD